MNKQQNSEEIGMSELVSYEQDDRIALITINNPPVNALSQGVREGLRAAVQQFVADDSADVAVIAGSGRLFIGRIPSLAGCHQYGGGLRETGDRRYSWHGTWRWF